jgi:hypothetical protein
VAHATPTFTGLNISKALIERALQYIRIDFRGQFMPWEDVFEIPLPPKLKISKILL